MLIRLLVTTAVLVSCGKIDGNSSSKATRKDIVVKRSGEIAAYFVTGHETENMGAWFFIPSVGIPLINTFTGAFIVENIYFSGTGCTGTAYYEGHRGLCVKDQVVKSGAGSFYKLVSSTSTATYTSYLPRASSSCSSSSGSLTDAVTLDSISTPTDLSDIAPLTLEVN